MGLVDLSSASRRWMLLCTGLVVFCRRRRRRGRGCSSFHGYDATLQFAKTLIDLSIDKVPNELLPRHCDVHGLLACFLVLLLEQGLERGSHGGVELEVVDLGLEQGVAGFVNHDGGVVIKTECG